MDNTIPVAIVGAGPSGLVMGLVLAKHHVKARITAVPEKVKLLRLLRFFKSIILEKEVSITHDPRGVYLNGDAVRILSDLGVERTFRKVGHGEHGYHGLELLRRQ